MPLSAKDSEWVGIKFSKDNNDPVTTNDEEKEIQIVETEEKETPPIFIIFPNLRHYDEKQLDQVSTSELTKLLVGQRPDFTIMKTAERLLPTQVRRIRFLLLRAFIVSILTSRPD